MTTLPERRGVPGPETEHPIETAAAKLADPAVSVTDAEAARRLTTKIQLRLDVIADNIEQVIELITDAKAGNVHAALGYASWTAYVMAEFADQRVRFSRLDRERLAQLLAEQGMSTRAIAPVVGVSKSQVAEDLRKAPVQNWTPEEFIDQVVSTPPTEEQIERLAKLLLTANPGTKREFRLVLARQMVKGRRKTDTTAMSSEDRIKEIVRCEREADELEQVANALRRELAEAAADPKKITGLDGKTYARPVPTATEPSPKPSRRPLPDAYRDAVHDARKAVDRVARLHADERFAANRKNLNSAWWREVSRVAATVGEIEADLDGNLNCGDCGQRLPITGEFASRCADCQRERSES